MKELEQVAGFFESLGKEHASQLLDLSIKQLADGLSTNDAKSFTERINRFYAKQGIKDEAGNIVKVATPGEALRKITMDYDQFTGEFSLTPGEERWLRSDKLYGQNILGKLGFKYTNLGG